MTTTPAGPPGPPGPPDPPDPSDALVDALVQTSFATMAHLTRIGAEHDLSLTQLRVLAILRDRRLRMTDLAAYLGLDKSTMTGLVDRAAARGLVTRARNVDDGRAFDVVVTPAGLRLAEQVRGEVGSALAASLTGLTPQDRRRLQGLLDRLG